MKLSLKELLGYTISTSNGTPGKIRDFLFDEERWVIRYIDADLGNIFTDSRVLVPKMFMKDADTKLQHFEIELRNEDMENCPKLDDVLPVSREYEQRLNKHYSIPNYWTSPNVLPIGVHSLPMIVRSATLPMQDAAIDESEIETSLRRFNELLDYTIEGRDGEFGKVADLIVDTEDWSITSAIVDTSSWLPWSRKVILGIRFVKGISYTERTMYLNLSTEVIEQSKEYDPSMPVNEQNEKQFDFRGKQVP